MDVDEPGSGGRTTRGKSYQPFTPLTPINRFKACVKPLPNEFSFNPILHPRDKHGMSPDIFSRRSRQVLQSALNLFRPPPMPRTFLYILPIMSLDPQCP